MQTYLTAVTAGSYHTRLTVTLPGVRVTMCSATGRTVASWVVQLGGKTQSKEHFKHLPDDRCALQYIKVALRVQFLAVMASP